LKKDFPEFQKKFTEHMNAQDFSAHRKEVSVDKVIKLDEIGFKLIQQTQKYKPFGMGNPKPLFLIKDFEIE
jgi:single-stranded DNA-specific DHH superfamily exonuclease